MGGCGQEKEQPEATACVDDIPRHVAFAEQVDIHGPVLDQARSFGSSVTKWDPPECVLTLWTWNVSQLKGSFATRDMCAGASCADNTSASFRTRCADGTSDPERPSGGRHLTGPTGVVHAITSLIPAYWVSTASHCRRAARSAPDSERRFRCRMSRGEVSPEWVSGSSVSGEPHQRLGTPGGCVGRLGRWESDGIV